MAWTSPRTWSTSELVTAAIMNTHVRDNLLALKSPPSGVALLNSNISTTSTSFVDLTGATVTFTTAGGKVLVLFQGTQFVASGSVDETGAYRLLTDGVDSGQLALVRTVSTGSVADYKSVAMMYVSGTLSAGSHTFKVQWKSVGGAQITMVAASALARLIAVEALF
jgi:hypothetical protein